LAEFIQRCRDGRLKARDTALVKAADGEDFTMFTLIGFEHEYGIRIYAHYEGDGVWKVGINGFRKKFMKTM
jgi:hypothetical protein